MKFSRIALAVAALGAASAASAASVNFAGATATSISTVKALNALCAGGVTVYKDNNTSTTALGNVFTVKCASGNFTGSGVTVDTARFNLSGGSASAALRTNITGGSQTEFLDEAASTCVDIGPGTGSLSFLSGASSLKNCTTSVKVTEFAAGGHMDVEGTLFTALGVTTLASVPASSYVASGFTQAFGLAVSPKLYAALQEYQVAKGLLPASCATIAGTTYTATNDTTPACQPSISKPEFAALAKNGVNTFKSTGAAFLTGAVNNTQSTDLTGVTLTNAIPAGSAIQWCRRPNTSGTQASTELYFLNRGNNGSLGGSQSVFGLTGTTNVTQSLATSVANSGSSNAITCLSNTATYAVGTLSLENNPIGTANGYRFVKVQGTTTAEGVAGSAQTAEAIAGRYDFVYETVKYCPAGVCDPLLNAVDTALPPGSSTPGVFLSSEQKFKRNGKSTQPYTLY